MDQNEYIHQKIKQELQSSICSAISLIWKTDDPEHIRRIKHGIISSIEHLKTHNLDTQLNDLITLQHHVHTGGTQ